MTTISATPILKSRHSKTGKEVFTVLCWYPRIIHSELMTHRAFSRNSASSRAIPVAKLIDSIIKDPFVPLFWGKNQKGMQAGDECTEEVETTNFSVSREKGGTNSRDAWRLAMWNAIQAARSFDAAGYHKQIVNRLIEPFMHITVLITATEWDNFFDLRIHPAAEPHIQLLAQRIKEAKDNCPTQELSPGGWHLPFDTGTAGEELESRILRSIACCASTSYKTVDNFDMTMERAAKIFDQLKGPPLHASPMEHVCQADYYNSEKYLTPSLHGNFVGFNQYRRLMEKSLI